eukprot:TRINITY_DN4822_c0_g1_i1.p1 TRINITY_DN4822_c0_g1~~TRINITY_DN4822_c0_g1_i1.p1  ORF type:complete len:1079 (+),score=321.61 TRINITY_DN4822_c0_g1_i1:140-3376(+)
MKALLCRRNTSDVSPYLWRQRNLNSSFDRPVLRFFVRTKTEEQPQKDLKSSTKKSTPKSSKKVAKEENEQATPVVSRIGIFGDIHFQDKGLARIKDTADWIIDELERQKVQAVVCLGDVLDTREMVSVNAQSTAFRFFNELSRRLANVPIHILLGNHDMNLKHSHDVSSLDSLAMDGMKASNIYLHKGTAVAELNGNECLLMPYYEDQGKILADIAKLEKERGKDWLSKVVGFGHLAIDGAKRYHSVSKPYEGPTGAGAFAGLKRVFSGHFHVHQKLGRNFVYVGSPLQFNFGDSGDERGIVIYDTAKDIFKHIVNPHCHAFRKITDNDVSYAEKNPKLFERTFVMVQYTSAKTPQQKEEIRRRLLNIGVLDVKQESVIEKVIKDAGIQVASANIEDLIDKFVASVAESVDKHKKQGKEWDSFLQNRTEREKLVHKGKEIVQAVNRSKEAAHPSLEREGAVFHADITRVKMTDFMGVQGTLEINISDLQDGVWTLEGSNGSGKSTLLEAITWCQFGEFLRSDMLKDFAVNDNSDSKECSVRVEFANGFIIERSRKKGKTDQVKTFQKEKGSEKEIYLEENEKGTLKTTQALLDHKLGMNYSTFCKSIILGQNIVSNFISGGKDQRRVIIEEALGLEKFDLYHDQAKLERVTIEKEIAGISSVLESAQQKVLTDQETNNINVTEVKEKIQAKRKHRAAVVEEHSASATRLKSERSALETARDATKAHLENFNVTETEAAAKQKRQIAVELRRLSNAVSTSESTAASLLRVKECPTCAQPVDEARLQGITDRIVKSISGIRADLKALHHEKVVAKEIEGIKASLPLGEVKATLQRLALRLLEEASTVEKSVDDAAKERRSKEVALNDAQRKILEFDNKSLQQENERQRQISQIEKDIEVLEAEMKQKSQFGEVRAKEAEMLRASIESYKASLSLLNEKFQLVRFWELGFDKKSKANSGFSSLRAFVLENSVKELNTIFQAYMDRLNASHLTVTLSPDLELQENYGKRSGGERKRTDLVTLFAMFELVRQRSRYQSQFLALDEVFDALDKEGQRSVRSVLDMITDRVRKIFVVSHADIFGK